MRLTIFISVLTLALFASCEYESIEQEPTPLDGNFHMRVSSSFNGSTMDLYTYYPNVNGDNMSFEQIKMYIADVRLVRTDGLEVPVTEIEYFNFEGPEQVRSFDVPAGSYSGMIYHVGVPVTMNGTDDPDFLTNQYGPGNPLNIQNGMYWNWSNGYRFVIYEGRLDTTPNILNDVPAFFSIHMGKDTLYTTMNVDLPMQIGLDETTTFHIDWDLAKSFYTAADTLDLRSPLESQFHGEDLNLGFRFQTCFKESLSHSVE